jgi:DNA-directed RNA polymerase specialized sigma24 family protein
MQLTESLLKELIKSKFSYCLNKAENITGRRDIAEDCAMMAIMAVWERQSEIKDMECAGALLYVATRNFALTALRNEKMRSEYRESVDPFINIEIDADFKEISEIAIKEIEQAHKSKNYSNVLKAHIHGLNNKDIALVLGLTYQHVRKIKTIVFSFLKHRLPAKGII